MKSVNILKPTFWKSVAFLIIIFGLYSTYLRFTEGLGATTNLSDAFPWGMWIGFDILCGVCLAAGGFLICTITHIFNIEKFKPLTRPAILTAFLGYLLVVFALMFDLGRPLSIWHAIIMWNPRSVMFEVAWCVMLYTTVLFLEFSPIFLERLQWKKVLSLVRKLSVPIMILGILLSTLHQSSLGSLFLIVPSKMHPLWYSALLPVYFYLTAIAVGFSMIIFEAYLSARAFGRGIELDLLTKIGFFSGIFLCVYLLIKGADLILSNKIGYLFTLTDETLLFWSEIIIGIIIPAVLLLQPRFRENRKWLYISSVFVIAGALFNRMNVSITSIAWSTDVSYFPSVYEISITLMIVVLGMIAFNLAVSYLPVFTHEEQATETAHETGQIPVIKNS